MRAMIEDCTPISIRLFRLRNRGSRMLKMANVTTRAVVTPE